MSQFYFTKSVSQKIKFLQNHKTKIRHSKIPDLIFVFIYPSRLPTGCKMSRQIGKFKSLKIPQQEYILIMDYTFEIDDF